MVPTGSSSSILLLILLTCIWYSLEHSLKEIEDYLSLYMLSDKEQPLSLSKLLPMSSKLSNGLMTMLISGFGVKLLEMEAI